MFNRKIISVAVASTFLVASASAIANTKKDDDKDSVGSWGPWQGVQTAAGPGAGGINITPLLIQFANAGNNTEGSAFVAGADGQVDNAGFRQYMAWYSRKHHQEGETTERGNFVALAQPFLNAVPVEGGGEDQPTLADATNGVVSYVEGKRKPYVQYTIGSDAGSKEHGTRKLRETRPEHGMLAAADEAKRHVVERLPNTFRDGKKYNNRVVKVANEQRVEFWLGGVHPYNMGEMPYTMVFGEFVGQDTFEEQRKRATKNAWKTVSNYSVVNNSGDFILGFSSTLDAVNSVLAGANELHYSGGFMNGGYVGIDVITGANASWEGRFNMGGPGASFEVANGSFNGVDLVGTAQTMSFDGPQGMRAMYKTSEVISGQVNASFFGDQAQAIAGVADVTFDGPAGRQVDVFAASSMPSMPEPPIFAIE